MRIVTKALQQLRMKQATRLNRTALNAQPTEPTQWWHGTTRTQSDIIPVLLPNGDRNPVHIELVKAWEQWQLTRDHQHQHSVNFDYAMDAVDILID